MKQKLGNDINKELSDISPVIMFYTALVIPFLETSRPAFDPVDKPVTETSFSAKSSAKNYSSGLSRRSSTAAQSFGNLRSRNS